MNAAEFYALAPLKTKSVPHGTGEVCIRELTLPERLEFLEIARTGETNKSMCYLLRKVIPALKDETDEAITAGVGTEPLAKLSSLIMELSDLLPKKKEEAGDAGKEPSPSAT